MTARQLERVGYALLVAHSVPVAATLAWAYADEGAVGVPEAMLLVALQLAPAALAAAVTRGVRTSRWALRWLLTVWGLGLPVTLGALAHALWGLSGYARALTYLLIPTVQTLVALGAGAVAWALFRREQSNAP